MQQGNIYMKLKNPFETKISFFKMHGSGNDFILLLNDELKIAKENMSIWAQKMCTRSFGVGADGLIFLESTPEEFQTNYRWHFYNADGSRAEMCGNGARCAAKLAYEAGLAPRQHIFGTDAGTVQAEVKPEQEVVKIQLTKPKDFQPHIKLHLHSYEGELHFVDTGVPHTVFILEDPSSVDIEKLGPEVRFHPFFSPSGTNVNIVQIKNNKSIFIRTYERGVEAETYACGTGAAAAAYVAQQIGLCTNQVEITTSGGEHLDIFLENNQIFLQGKATIVYQGLLNLKALDIEI